jgi:DNA-binding transcriptional MerR regulator
MKAGSEKLRIGEVAKRLNVEQFVIRFWEREFGLKAHRSPGGQRFYNERDMKRILLIKELLYDNGLTIAGAKKYLQQNKSVPASKKVTPETENTTIAPAKITSNDMPYNSHLVQRVTSLKEQLIKIRTLIP